MKRLIPGVFSDASRREEVSLNVSRACVGLSSTKTGV